MKSASPPVVVYEDRPDNLIGVQLLVLSLNRYSPDLRALVTVPGAPEAFRDWLQAQPNAELYDTRLEASGWDVKPSLLLEHLGNGSPSVAWVDSDMIVTGNLSAKLAELPTESLIGTEDVWWGKRQGTPQRTLAWGLKPGRVLPVTVNTGFLRAATTHVPLLERWRDMLTMPDYRAAQKLGIGQRPLHLMGDQEVLTALRGAVDWQDVPVRLLRRGLDVAQCYGPGGFSPRERLYLRLNCRSSCVHGPQTLGTKSPTAKAGRQRRAVTCLRGGRGDRRSSPPTFAVQLGCFVLPRRVEERPRVDFAFHPAVIGAGQNDQERPAFERDAACINGRGASRRLNEGGKGQSFVGKEALGLFGCSP